MSQPTKYDELKGLIKSLDEKITASSMNWQNLLELIRDMDYRMLAMKEVALAGFSLPESTPPQTYEVLCDELRGLRHKHEDEPIEVGDTVMVRYEAKVGEEVVAREASLMVRVGLGAMNFETALVGHFKNETVEFKYSLPDGSMKDKEVNFVIDIFSVKAKVVRSITPFPTAEDEFG